MALEAQSMLGLLCARDRPSGGCNATQPDTQQDYRRDLESVGNRQMALIFLGAVPYFFSTVFINKNQCAERNL